MALLGLWCGLGLYLDSMFLMTLAGMVFAGLVAAGLPTADSARPSLTGQSLRAWSLDRPLVWRWASALAPRLDGSASWSILMTPTTISSPGASSRGSAGRARSKILLLDCLPRLIAGHRLPGLEADPDPALLGSAAPCTECRRSRPGLAWLALALTVLALGWVLRGDPRLRCVARSGRADLSQRRDHGRYPGLLPARHRRVSGQPQHLQFGQLPLPGLVALALVDRAWLCHARVSAWCGGRVCRPRVCLPSRLARAVHDRCGRMVSSIWAGSTSDASPSGERLDDRGTRLA